MPGAESTGCYVCAKHALGDEAEGGVLLRDELVYAGHVHTVRGTTAYRGHLVVEPLRHVPGIGDLSDAEAEAVGRACSRAARVLQETGGADHVDVFVAGDEVPHLHVHLVPRYPGTPREFWGPGVTRWPDGPRVDADTMRSVVAALRRRLEGS